MLDIVKGQRRKAQILLKQKNLLINRIVMLWLSAQAMSIFKLIHPLLLILTLLKKFSL